MSTLQGVRAHDPAPNVLEGGYVLEPSISSASRLAKHLAGRWSVWHTLSA